MQAVVMLVVWLRDVSATYFLGSEWRCELALLLREDDVRTLLPMPSAVNLLDQAFRAQAEGTAENRARIRIPFPDGMLHYMGASVSSASIAGLKAYTAGKSGARFVVLLFDTRESTLLAVMEADWLGRVRTGAASGLATRLLARDDAEVAGVIGAGGQAQTQIEALLAVRPFTLIKVFCRTQKSREELVARLRNDVSCRLEAVDSAHEAVSGSQVVTTITTSDRPVFDGAWIESGCHINAAGSNLAYRQEIDVATVRKASCIVVDALDQAQQESGDLIAAAESGHDVWSDAAEMHEVVGGKRPGRRSADDITLYESQGVALEDVYVAHYVYQEAIRTGRGEPIAFGGRDE